MPYILKETRLSLEEGHKALKPGELNYQFSKLCNDYIAMKGLGYQSINDVLGALEGAKLEFYRRVASPYENIKCSQNSDVYTVVNI